MGPCSRRSRVIIAAAHYFKPKGGAGQSGHGTHPFELCVASTASGRASCSYPNLQQVPSRKSSKEFRTVFVAKPGYKIVAGDFASMELRAAGHIAGDSRMIEAFRDGVDLYKLTASQMQRKPVEEVADEERSHAKPINFGAIYGEGARGLVASAWKDFELLLTEAEAREWLDVFS
jgi:DNA polymerase I-like protein with 3'-5' exonuclease and polymerase domains